MASKPQFRFRLNGTNVPDLLVRPVAHEPGEWNGEWELAGNIGGIGWFALEDSDILEYRDETAWSLLPREMRQASLDKCWCRATPQELIEILLIAGVIE
jgi:hypothetical protein